MLVVARLAWSARFAVSGDNDNDPRTTTKLTPLAPQ